MSLKPARASGRLDSSIDPRARRPASTTYTSTGGVSRWCGCDSATHRARRNPDVSLRPLPPTFGVKPMSATTNSTTTNSTSSLAVASLGTPRIGPRRELKFALESFWSGATDEKALIETGIGLRAANWARQKKLGIGIIPSNDFSFYDQVLDTCVIVGAIPESYGWKGGPVPLSTYFAMARGAESAVHDANCGHAHHGHGDTHGVPALEMTKWFDTNYHYMVPELGKDQTFALASRKPIEEYLEAKALGYQTRPVLVGPVTFLKLAKSKDTSFNPLSLL